MLRREAVLWCGLVLHKVKSHGAIIVDPILGTLDAHKGGGGALMQIQRRQVLRNIPQLFWTPVLEKTHAKVRSSSTKILGKCNPCRKLHHTNLFGRSLFRSADSNLRWVWAEMCLKWKHTGGRRGPLGKRQMQNRETTQTWNVFLAQIRIHASSSMSASLCCLC